MSLSGRGRAVSGVCGARGACVMLPRARPSARWLKSPMHGRRGRKASVRARMRPPALVRRHLVGALRGATATTAAPFPPPICWPPTCWTPTTGRLRLAVYDWLPTAGRRRLAGDDWPATLGRQASCWLPPATGRLPVANNWPSLTADCLLLCTCCRPPSTGRLLLTACYWPHATGRPLLAASDFLRGTSRWPLAAYD